ncbi:hypothetical protein [Paenibacillus ginsengihumi]|uniref:hypothetical protein n=1 Tax=Paenibacillus ginsengihumi TaxID=431596 RepID=UPI0003692C9D|nr:hypothetical protein [Paenibacillus ginsengihumi]
MIESTNAFKKFANGKSWDQLNFQVQQQIRLAAILEQAYARYGNQLQQNVMTRQGNLIGQLKDIKLNLSQAFLPIWDAVLPALTRMAEGVAYLTEQLARFAYWLRGWDYDEMTKGTDKQTDAVNDQSKSYDDLAKSAAKARNQLAAFDEINQIGDYGSGGGSGGSGGSGGLGGSGGGSGGSGRDGFEVPKLPELPRLRLEFDPPVPPDAGIGAVATAVVSTVTEMTAKVKRMWDSMWQGVVTQTAAFRSAITPEWQAIQQIIQQTEVPLASVRALWSESLAGMQSTLRGYVSAMVPDWSSLQKAIQQLANPLANLRANWQFTLDYMLSQLNAYRPQIELGWWSMQTVVQQTEVPLGIVRNAWQMTLDYMRSQLNLHRPTIEADWRSMQTVVQQTEVPLSNIRTAWQMTLLYMQTQLNAFRPYLEYGWQLIQNIIQQTATPLASIRTLWHDTLNDMQSKLNAYRPYLEAGWGMIGMAVLGVAPALATIKSAWADALEGMLSKVQQTARSIIREINEIISAWASLQSELSGSRSRSRANTYDYVSAPVTAPAPAPEPSFRQRVNDTLDTPAVDALKGLFEGYVAAAQWISENISEPLKPISEQVLIPGAGAANAGRLGVAGASKAASAISKWLDDLINSVKGLGAVPQMAKGGIVSSPTLAMIGEAGTEAVVPLEDTSFVDAIGSAVGTAVVTAMQMAGAGNQAAGTGGDIVVNLDGATLARVLLPYTQREQQRQGPTVIREV